MTEFVLVHIICLFLDCYRQSLQDKRKHRIQTIPCIAWHLKDPTAERPSLRFCYSAKAEPDCIFHKHTQRRRNTNLDLAALYYIVRMVAVLSPTQSYTDHKIQAQSHVKNNPNSLTALK